MTRERPAASDVRVERRARQSWLYTPGQILGREPIWLRRRTDKVRLALHVVGVVALVAATALWVLPRHAFAGPVLLVLAPGRGVHLGDLPALAFVAAGLRSAWIAARLARRRPPRTRTAS